MKISNNYIKFTPASMDNWVNGDHGLSNKEQMALLRMLKKHGAYEVLQAMGDVCEIIADHQEYSEEMSDWAYIGDEISTFAEDVGKAMEKCSTLVCD